jgi:hypothetical protein
MRDDLRPFKRSVAHSVRAVLGDWRVSALEASATERKPLGEFPAWQESPYDVPKDGHSGDIPRAELANPIVRHVLPEAGPIDNSFFE